MIMKTKMNDAAQHARSAASRLDDVIDRSALEQAREGLGGRDMEEPLIGLGVQKSTLERNETAVSHHAICSHVKRRCVLATVVQKRVRKKRT